MSITLSKSDRRRLEAISADRNTPQTHVWRAPIVPMTVDGVGTNAIMVATRTEKTTVWRWRERFVAEGVDGLPRDRTRVLGTPPVAEAKAAQVVEMTLKPPPHGTTRAMATATGLAVSTVQKIFKAYRLAPHRWRSFKLSNDPASAEKLHAVVGLYVAPAHAVALRVDETSQIQARDRTQPGLPPKKVRGATMTPYDKRHGTTTLFAALNVLTGEVFERNMPRLRHQDFIRLPRTPWSATFPPVRSFTRSSATTLPTSTPSSAPGWRGIRAEPSRSRRPRVPG